MARTISRPPKPEVVEYIVTLHSTWNIDLKEEVDIMPIIYNLYSYGLPFSIEAIMFSDLKSKFDDQHSIVHLISEMMIIQNRYLSESYYMENELNPK
jgi:hypothetical protein